MRELSPQDRRVDINRAFAQWTALYQQLAANGLVYLLPAHAPLQDLTFTANLGTVLHHLEANHAVVSNFRTSVRSAESIFGYSFFQNMGFRTTVPPYHFEGEADLKYVRDNIYIGGHGLRTSRKALNWLAETFAMHIVPVETHDEHLYHLDCLVFPLSSSQVLLCAEACSPASIKAIEHIAEIIPVSKPLAYRGITNLVRCGNRILCDSNIADLSKNDPLYAIESEKISVLERVCTTNALDLHLLNLSEFYKCGAMLSCLVLHLNVYSISPTL